jgi:hypothetical protein
VHHGSACAHDMWRFACYHAFNQARGAVGHLTVSQVSPGARTASQHAIGRSCRSPPSLAHAAARCVCCRGRPLHHLNVAASMQWRLMSVGACVRSSPQRRNVCDRTVMQALPCNGGPLAWGVAYAWWVLDVCF